MGKAFKLEVMKPVKPGPQRRPGRHRKRKLAREKKQSFFTQGRVR